jgi:hypothetical protein
MAVTIRCQLPDLEHAYRLCGGVLGSAPAGAKAGRRLLRYRDAAPDRSAYRCDRCHRISEVELPVRKSLQDAA